MRGYKTIIKIETAIIKKNSLGIYKSIIKPVWAS